MTIHSSFDASMRNSSRNASDSRVPSSERMAELWAELGTRESLAFRELFRIEASKEEWIVTFLALLELARQQAVHILQQAAFGDIVIRKRADAPEELSVDLVDEHPETPVAGED